MPLLLQITFILKKDNTNTRTSEQQKYFTISFVVAKILDTCQTKKKLSSIICLHMPLGFIVFLFNSSKCVHFN